MVGKLLFKTTMIRSILLVFIVIIGLSTLNAQNMKLKITVNNQELTATLNENETVNEFIKMLPMTIYMTELHGNEKYCKLSKDIQGKAVNPDKIRKGDIMLWISNILVIFYDTFPTPYDYVKLATVDDIDRLTNALGDGNVSVKFEIIQNENK